MYCDLDASFTLNCSLRFTGHKQPFTFYSVLRKKEMLAFYLAALKADLYCTFELWLKPERKNFRKAHFKNSRVCAEHLAGNEYTPVQT